MMRGLRRELILLLLLIALVPLVVSLGIGWWQARKTLVHELSQGLRAIATRQSSLINDTVRDVELQTERLAGAGAVIRAIQDLADGGASEQASGTARREMQDLVTATLAESESGNLFLVARDGTVLFAARPAEEAGRNLLREFPDSELTRVVDRARTILETELSDLRVHPVTGRPVAYSATPVFSGGRLLGVLAMEVDPVRILRGHDNYTGLGSTGETVIATQQGGRAVVVAPLRSDPQAAFNVALALEDGVRQPLVEAVRGRRGAGLARDQRGKEVFAVWRYIPAVRWGIVVKIDRDEAFASVDRLGLLVGLLLLSTAALVPVVAFHQARRITGPILALRDATNRMAGGDFDVDTTVSARNEIAELASSFGTMARRLKATFEDLRRTTEEREAAAAEAIAAKHEVERINENLEAIVEARTRELTENNAQLQQTLDDLGRTQKQLIVREKMASLGELTSGVAHEISNPLNFVNNFADLSVEVIADLRGSVGPEARNLSEDARADLEELLPTLEENLRRIHEHGRRAQRIVQGMIELTRGTSGERRPTDLNRFVQEFTRATLQASRSREGVSNVSVEFDLAPDMPLVPVYGSELSRALLNLLSNATWAAAERAKAAGGDYAPHVRVATRMRGGEAVVTVRDNGIGIPPENVRKIFQPFFTTRPTGAGSTGLGLSMAWEVVVSQHGGRLEVQSVPGEFTEFEILLPVA